MAAKHHILRTAAVGFAAVAVTATASVTAQAAHVDEESGHLTCPPGTQVRIWSNAGGDTVTHYWYSDNGKHGSDVWDISHRLGPVDNQTFTLQRDVYWRVVAEGPMPPNIFAGARCHHAA